MTVNLERNFVGQPEKILCSVAEKLGHLWPKQDLFI